MIDSTPLPVVVDQGAAGTTQLVVEADTGGKTEKALQYALFETREAASTVTLQGEDILAGPEDRLDALTNRGKMRTLPGFVLASGPDHRCLKGGNGRGELFARVALVAEQHLPAFPTAALEEFDPDLSFVFFGRGDFKGPGSTVSGEDGMQPDAPEVAGVRSAVPVVTDVRKCGAKRRIPASTALDRGGVDKQEIVVETGALLAKDDQQPGEVRSETTPTFEVAGLIRDVRKEMGKRALRPSKEAPVGRLPHDGLGHRQGDDLSISRLPSRVPSSFWQKIIGCAINEGAEGVEVGVHRGLLVDGVLDTADFGPPASNPFCRAIFVESII